MTDTNEVPLDDLYNKLLDPTSLKVNEAEAADYRNKLSRVVYNTYRKAAKDDLFFLCSILGYDRLSTRFHGHFCSWLQSARESRFRMVLLPRGHYKSTIMTIAEAIQIILPDDTKEQPWPRNLGTDCRLLIAHETELGAQRFLYAITSQIISNPVLRGLFPEIVPKKGPQRINKSELDLPRVEQWPEPTIDTMGVGAKSQGKHYNYIKLDDIFGSQARDSDAEKLTTTEWFDNIQSFFSSFTKDHLDLVGTRWAFDDIYAHAMGIYGDKLLRYIRPIEEYNPKTEKLELIFPEEFSPESLQQIRQNKKIWAAQYCNNPELSSTEFEQSWLQFYYWTGPNQITIKQNLATGPQNEVLDTRNFDVCILIDPAMTGKAGLVVTGMDSKGRVFILEALKEEWRPPELVDLLFRLVLKYSPRTVAIEEVLFSGLWKPWLEREMILRNRRFHIDGVKTNNRAKEVRVRGLSNYFASRNIFFNPQQELLLKEYKQFGATDDYHMLDALAYGPLVWRRGLSYSFYDPKMLSSSNEEILASRDAQTGYSLFNEDEKDGPDNTFD